MNRREFLGAGLAGAGVGFVRPDEGHAKTLVTVAFHFVGMHCRAVDSKKGVRHNIVSLGDKNHVPVMIVKCANILRGSLGSNAIPGSKLTAWRLCGRYVFPEAAEAGDTKYEGDCAPMCPRTLDDWRWMSRLHDLKKAQGRLAGRWREKKAAGARYELHRTTKQTPIGEFQCEPPFCLENRRAVWSTHGGKQVLSDRFVYRVKTTDPSINGDGQSVTLKLAPAEPQSGSIEAEIKVHVVTVMPGRPRSGCPTYVENQPLEHSGLGHDLLDGKKPDPRYDHDCSVTEDSNVHEEATRFLALLMPAFVQNAKAGSESDPGRRLGPRSSLDTFCPGWDSGS